MATINVTYVVERGSFIEVPSEISMAERVRLTDARIKSNEALFSNSTGWKRLSMNLLTLSGVNLLIDLLKLRLFLTIERDRGEEENRSSPSPFLERFTSVSVTVRDFFENQSASTMITPAPSNQPTCATTGSESTPMCIASTFPPDAATP